jgi:hypothetical protein
MLIDGASRLSPFGLDRAALVGCGVMTGVGAVFNAAKSSEPVGRPRSAAPFGRLAAP